MSFLGRMFSRKPNLCKKAINNPLLSLLHLSLDFPQFWAPVFLFTNEESFVEEAQRSQGNVPGHTSRKRQNWDWNPLLHYAAPKAPPQNMLLVLGQHSTEHPDFARNSAVQLLLDMGQWMMFCSLDWKHWNGGAFPTFLISQAEACDAKPTSGVHFLLCILYNTWNVVGTCLG